MEENSGPPRGGEGGAPIVRRLRTLKRRKEEKENSKNQVKLERVLGLTVTSNASLATSFNTGLVAYPAGCTVVLFNPRKSRQTHIINPSKKTITTVGWSEDGRYLVTGECGHTPSVRVWDIQEKQCIAEFPGHKYGVNCVAFAPNNKYIVSVGSQHDMIVNVWDWRSNVKVASNKVSTKVKAISFAENGSYFVTAGNRHIKFWYLEYSRAGSGKYKEPVPLMGRSAILGEQRNNYFCDVACGRGEMGDSTYAITKSGLLCEFNNRRLLDKWVELRTTSANCLSVGEELIFIGCADGIVRCFSPQTLQFVTTLPRTHYLGVDVSAGLTISHMANHPQNAQYPDACAISYDEQNGRVSVVYNDHSLYIWDVKDVKKVGKSYSFLYHSACIWGLEMYQSPVDGGAPVLPPGSFITCGSDDTIRVWNLDHNMMGNTNYRRNIYSEELLKVLYIDPNLAFIKDADNSLSGEKEPTVYDQRNGVRCIRVNPNDGRHLSSGDRAGNIRVHDLETMNELCKIEAHDAEVLCLEYSNTTGQFSNNSVGKFNSPHTPSSYFLASASRDRLIHLFNGGSNYNFLATLDDHSASITAVRFLPSTQESNNIQMVSCGADKSIIFRDVNIDNSGVSFSRVNHIVGKTTLYDMELDRSGKHILTACQDRSIRVYSVTHAKQTKAFKGSVSEDGTLIKVVLDRSGIYCATSCTDKTLALYDYHTGELMATMSGHSELVTGLAFTPDCKHLISVSGDGCIFVWRLPVDMVHTMQARLASTTAANTSTNTSSVRNSSRTYITGDPKDNNDFGSVSPDIDPNANYADNQYRFNVGQLPAWAKTKLSTDNNLTPPASSSSTPKGRWAGRIGGEGQAGEESSSVKDASSLEWARTLSSMSEMETGSMSPYPPARNSQETESMSPYPGGRTSQRNWNTNSSNTALDSFNDADVDDYSTQEDGGESTEPENTNPTMYFDNKNNNNNDDDDAKSGKSMYRVNASSVGASGVGAAAAAEIAQRQRAVWGGSRGDLATTASDEEDEEETGGGEADRSKPMRREDDESPSRRSVTPTRGSVTTLDTSVVSGHCVSMENVDKVGRREKFMQATYDFQPGGNDGRMNQSSISSAYREGGALVRNAGAIERAREQRNADQNRRREELHRRIEETRIKLQSISHKSMKGSRSINDLSMFASAGESGRESPMTNTSATATYTLPRQNRNNADNERNNTLSGGGGGGGSASKASNSNNSDSSGLRRACSLSDLSKPGGAAQRRILPSTPNNVSGKKSTGSRGDRMERRMSIKSQDERPYSSGGRPLSRLEQHERMLAERERERASGRSNQGTPGPQQRPRSAASMSAIDTDNADVPSYMRSTSASTRKEKVLTASTTSRGKDPSANRSRIRRNSSTSKSVTDICSELRDVESSSEEDHHHQPNHRKRSQHGGGHKSNISPSKAYSHMDISQSGHNDAPQPIIKNNHHNNLNSGPGGYLTSPSGGHPYSPAGHLNSVGGGNISSPASDTPPPLDGHQQQHERKYTPGRAKLKTTTIISNDGSVVMNPAAPPPGDPSSQHINTSVSGQSDADDVTRSRLTRNLAIRTKSKVQEDADNLLKLYKRVSLDDDLEEEQRAELLSVLVQGAHSTIQTLHLVCKNSATRTPGISQNNQQEFGSNPYLQRMLENYSALMLPNNQSSPSNIKM